MQVKVTKDIGVEELQLPPCVPKSSKPVADSTHPHRIAVVVTRKYESPEIKKDLLFATRIQTTRG